MGFNEGQCWALHLRRNNPMYPQRLGADLLGRSSVEKQLGVLGGDKLTMSLHCPCGQESQCYPGVYREECGQQAE